MKINFQEVKYDGYDFHEVIKYLGYPSYFKGYFNLKFHLKFIKVTIKLEYWVLTHSIK